MRALEENEKPEPELQPDQEVLDAIQSYWAAIDAESTEATNYVSLASIVSAGEALRQGLPGKAWDDVMVAEQRLISGIMPTRQELGL